MDSSGHIIGIDLGTTNSVVAVVEGNAPLVIANAEGQSKTPSVVGFMDDGEAIVGELAKRQAATQPQRTISSVKRLIGRFYEEIGEHEQYPFQIEENEDGMVSIAVDERRYTPANVSALILKKLKEAAEDYLDEPVQRAIITVPAYFDDLQRQATLEAAREAGLEVLRLINEPTAAAMAYGLGKQGQHNVAVYDFGGGTFDFSILDIDDKTFEVLVSTGDSHLGGDDLDELLVDFLADKFYTDTGIDLRDEILTLRRLHEAAEKAKCELSQALETMVSLPFIAYKDGQPLHLECTIARDTLEDLIEAKVQLTLDCCERGLKEAKLRPEEINKVILVGGSTRIPLVQEMVEDFFGIPPFKGLNPDEIVAAGAATQGAVMNGELEEVVLLDITPHTLGVEIRGDRRSTIIEKNSTIPIKVEKTYTTTEDNQAYVNIHVLQGQSEKASECRSLGKFTLNGIAPVAAGTPRIKVTFLVNADGIVEISATDVQSGAERSLTITHAYLSEEERRSQGDSHSRRRRRRRRTTRRIQRTEAGTGMRVSAGTMDVKTRPSETPSKAKHKPGETSKHEALVNNFAEINEITRTRIRPPEREEPAAADSRSGRKASSSVKQSSPPLTHPDELVHSLESFDRSPNGSSDAPAPAAPQQEFVAWEYQEVRPQSPIPQHLAGVVDRLTASATESDVAVVCQEDGKTFESFCQQHPEDYALQILLARYHILMKQAEEARGILDEMRGAHPELKASLFEIYGQLCRSFPNYVAARKDRAAMALDAGDYDMAITDLEFIGQREEDAETLDQLRYAYERVLEKRSDTTIEFKLVKLHLKQQRLDEAISTLQRLIKIPACRHRAARVLGLCFWQKGMRRLAWDKLRTLKLDDELKGILYRLSEDMERHDELEQARECLMCIYESDIHYEQIGERISKIEYRLDLQKKDTRYRGAKSSDTNSMELGGRFKILNELNRGSMGIVYKAQDMVIDEIVAIKVLNDFLCADPQAVERFKQEARAARKLTHSNIVRIHDMYDLGNKKVISMEYIEGDNLKDLLSRNVTFLEDMVLSYLMQICEGLAYAHRLQIVHRDIKPANIMITDNSQVKITDLGIAKLMNDKHRTKGATMVMGTPLYMAPEQIEGGPIDHRCDIYSLGIMLYEMVVGSPPFFEGNIEYQHLHNEPPQITQGVSDRLRSIITRCIEKDPDQRFQTVEEILARIF